MKRMLSLLLAATLIFALAACNTEKETASDLDSSTITQTESADNTETTESDEISSEAEMSSNNTSTPATNTSKPATSSKDNATGDKDNATSSKPTTTTTSKPTETNKPTTSTTTSTSSVPAKPTLPFNDLFDGGNALALTDKDTNGLTANRILNFSSYEIFHAYVFDKLGSIETKDWTYNIGNTTYMMNQYAVPEDVVYQYAASFFNIDAEAKNLLKASDRYDNQKGIFWIYDYIWANGYDAVVKGYEPLNNDEYVLYAEAIETNHPAAPHSECATTEECVLSRPTFKAKIKATGKRSYIVLSFEYIDSIPNNITKI